MSRLFSIAVLAAASAMGLGPMAQAEIASAWNDHPNARVRLVAGEGLYLGVEVVLAPGWKTYWRMPGDAGVPPAFDFSGSRNVAATEVLYPVPVAMPEAGGVAVGYMGTVTFPVRYTPADAGQPVAARLTFSFGVCKDVCIPLDSVLALDLPADVKTIGKSPQIAAALTRVPRVLADATRAIPALTGTTITVSGPRPGLRFLTTGATALFAEAPDGLFVPMPVRRQGPGDEATFEIDLTGSPDLKDLIGKALRVTLTTPTGGVETTVRLGE
jgi:DsbC/DsbD-like thiol-disulfide interchange protein